LATDPRVVVPEVEETATETVAIEASEFVLLRTENVRAEPVGAVVTAEVTAVILPPTGAHHLATEVVARVPSIWTEALFLFVAMLVLLQG
jgi:hypothetical protein